MNKYLEKVARLTHQDKEDLRNTAGIMAFGTVASGAANTLNQKLGLLGKATPHAKWYSGKNLAAAGVGGALGGISDFAALKFHRAQEAGKLQMNRG